MTKVFRLFSLAALAFVTACHGSCSADMAARRALDPSALCEGDTAVQVCNTPKGTALCRIDGVFTHDAECSYVAPEAK